MSVRVRFAPSPTGSLHVGGARTALFNYLFAKQRKGSFILRIEDTDQDRHQEEAVQNLIENLLWLGLDWEEGPCLDQNSLSSKGHFAPYRQKDRLKIYQEKAEQLIQQGKAYYCFMSPEEETQQKEKTIQKNQPWRVSSPYREFPLEKAQQKIEKGEKACIRFKTLERTNPYVIQDLIRGSVSFPSDCLGDFVLIRRDFFPVYNFSCAVDDSLMQITHVFRGEEHLSNSLKQKLIQEALGFSPPQIGHLSIILDKEKKKLSKRKGSASLEYYQQEGYLSSALLNFLALLGWNPGTTQEFFSKEELIKNFQIEDLNLSAAVFDEEKLLWLNQEHIKKLSEIELLKKLEPFLKIGEKDQVKKLIPLVRSGFKNLKQSANLLELLMQDSFKLRSSAQEVFKWPKSKFLLEKWLAFLKAHSEKKHISLEDFKSFQKQMQKEEQMKGKEFFMPLRCAFLGQSEGTEIKLLLQFLETKQLLQRAKNTFKQISV